MSLWQTQGGRGGDQQSRSSLPSRLVPRPYLCPVREEEGTGEIAGDAAENKDDGNTVPAGQLLQVPQDGHLEDYRHEAVYHAGRETHWHQPSHVYSRPPARQPQQQCGVEDCAGCSLGRSPSTGGPGGRHHTGLGGGQQGALPSMEEQRQPEPIELVWDLRVEEG